MKFNLHVPYALVNAWELWLKPGSLERIAGEVEEAGFDSISVSEHPIPPVDWLELGGHHALDPFVALSFMAAGSRRLRLLTNILVVPYHSPLLTAKAVASLDVLSGGRVTVGVAVGYLEPEFDAVGADFAGRAAAFSSGIEQMKAAWASDGTSEGGVPGYVTWPPPLQRPHPPIWVGGNGRAARRRAVALGDGWMPFPQRPRMAAVTGTPPIDSFEEFSRTIGELRREEAAAGRELPLDVSFGLIGRSAFYRDGATRAELEEEVGPYEQIGVTWLGVHSRAETPDGLSRELERWAPLIV